MDYSQNGEGKIIANYFGERKGVLLDIGANDGSVLSNSRGLMLAGWRGYLVEPDRAAFRKLLHLYAPGVHGIPPDTFTLKVNNVTLIQAAVANQNGPLSFYSSGTHLKKGDIALLSTTLPEEMARWKSSGEKFEKTEVHGITFHSLVTACGLGLGNVMDYTGATPDDVAEFNFISIDAEGADYDILKQIDLRSVGCELLCVEYNAKDEHKFIGYAAGAGMKLIHRNYENLIFAVA